MRQRQKRWSVLRSAGTAGVIAVVPELLIEFGWPVEIEAWGKVIP